jgi:hypothetical protein
MTERVAERYLGMRVAKIDPYVGSAVRHSINFLQEAEGLLKRPVEMHGVSAEQQVSNVLKSTVELIQLALKKLPPPTAR